LNIILAASMFDFTITIKKSLPAPVSQVLCDNT
jgi:hypothetical protein